MNKVTRWANTTANSFIDTLYWLLLKYKYPLQNATITFLLINFFFFYSSADFSSDTGPETNFWDALWYVIEAWLYVLFALIPAALNYKKSYRAVWSILALFLSIRATWEISAVILGVNVNEKIIMSCMFYLTCVTIFSIAFYPQVRWATHKLIKIIRLCRKRLRLLGRWLNGLVSR